MGVHIKQSTQWAFTGGHPAGLQWQNLPVPFGSLFMINDMRQAHSQALRLCHGQGRSQDSR